MILDVERQRNAAHFVSGEIVVIVGVKGAAGEVVGAGAELRVDRSSLEIAFGDVGRSDRDAELANRIERHRPA